ncbi:cadherin-like beta sandwich domain-containing protein [Roseburia inulinivorans]|uniref:cadherin-like beta sandwich domain-containing protein n=1 Tax=Roseburia inulinivorans TaxID=360807 RepID=UPI002491EC02|nr:cadherin-like beta sandwich domain-containing protein [Roseburia inulinivorans]
MKKKLGVIITLLTLCICLMTPQMHAKAASGKTTIAVSAGSLNIGQTVTVTAKALSASGDSAYANMVLTYDAGILEFVSCNATYGGGGGSISVASDSFSVTLKAIAAGKASISLSATDGVIFSTAEELDSMAGSSTSVTVKNEAAGGNSTNNGSSGSNGNAGNGSSSGTGSNNNTGSNTNTAALSADNSLKALTISPGTLSPAFKGSTTKYTATVDNSVTSIAVSATPVNEKATIESVTGNTNLAVGANVVQIVVKAENGTTATYKITVTRQAAGTTGSETTTTGGENGDDGNGDSETPEDTEEVDTTETPVSAADVVINNTTYHIADNFTEEQIPADFTEATVNFRGAECRGLTFNKGTISLIYLETDNVDATTGRFFIYDETRDVVYDFMKFTAGESSYVIPLLAPLDSVLPESYVQVSLQMPENTVMTAYQLPVEDGEEASDFYIFYGVNQDGTEGWYQYDAAEGTYQRVNGNITEAADSSSDDLAALQSEYDELSKKYKDAKSFSRNMIAVIIFVLAIAAVVILNIVLFGRKKKGKDELLEDDDSENEESEYESDEEDEFVEKSPEAPMKNAENTKKASKAGQTARTNKAGKPKKAEETEEAQEFEEDEDDYFDDEEEYIEEEHPINRAYREWNDYEDEIPSQSKKPVTEETSEKESSTENVKMDEQQKNETSIKNEKGLEVFDLNDL